MADADSWGPAYPRGSGVHVYEIDGSLLVRAYDGAQRLGIERSAILAVKGYSRLEPSEIGDCVLRLLQDVREVHRPAAFGKLSEYAALLVGLSPRRYSSYGQWMRAARLVAVHWVFDGVAVTREHADLKTSSWQVGQDGDKKHMMWPQTVHLGLDPRPDELGSAVLLLLQEPSIRSKVTATVQDHT